MVDFRLELVTIYHLENVIYHLENVIDVTHLIKEISVYLGMH